MATYTGVSFEGDYLVFHSGEKVGTKQRIPEGAVYFILTNKDGSLTHFDLPERPQMVNTNGSPQQEE